MRVSYPEHSADTIEELPFVELLASLRKASKPAGGLDTVRRFILNCHLRPGVKVLHAGCNVGFLSRELARLSGCEVVGIDISPAMVEAANQRAEEEGLTHLVSHEVSDMREMSLYGPKFDVVLSGGALAFVEGQRRAIEQWIGATKPYGLVADAELYYRGTPPSGLTDEVSAAIGVRVPQYDSRHWPDLFSHPQLEPYYRYQAEVKTLSDEEVEAHTRRTVEFGASGWSDSAKEAAFERSYKLFKLFNENLKHLNYQVLVYRRVPEDVEAALYL